MEYKIKLCSGCRKPHTTKSNYMCPPCMSAYKKARRLMGREVLSDATGAVRASRAESFRRTIMTKLGHSCCKCSWGHDMQPNIASAVLRLRPKQGVTPSEKPIVHMAWGEILAAMSDYEMICPCCAALETAKIEPPIDPKVEMFMERLSQRRGSYARGGEVKERKRIRKKKRRMYAKRKLERLREQKRLLAIQEHGGEPTERSEREELQPIVHVEVLAPAAHVDLRKHEEPPSASGEVDDQGNVGNADHGTDDLTSLFDLLG